MRPLKICLFNHTSHYTCTHPKENEKAYRQFLKDMADDRTQTNYKSGSLNQIVPADFYIYLNGGRPSSLTYPDEQEFIQQHVAHTVWLFGHHGTALQDLERFGFVAIINSLDYWHWRRAENKSNAFCWIFGKTDLANAIHAKTSLISGPYCAFGKHGLRLPEVLKQYLHAYQSQFTIKSSVC